MGKFMLIQNRFIKLILFFLIILVACTGNPESRHNPSGFKIPLPEKDFDSYKNKTRIQIKKATGGKLEEKWIDMRLPFEHKPDDAKCADFMPYKGALLIHGLTDTPFIMSDVGERFKEKCYWVRSILLPGHGTIPGDLLDVDYEEWVKAIDAGVDSFQGQVEDIYLVGFSTGSSLSLHYVLRKKNPKSIKGLVFLAPGIKEKSRFGFVAAFIAGIGNIIPTIAWLAIYPDEDKVKYESFTANAGAQFHSLTKNLRELAEKNYPITIPTFMAISSADATVDSDQARIFFCKITENAKNQMVWYTAKEKKDDPKETCGGFIVKRVRNLNAGILDYAHLSLPVHPDNTYYGRNGEYKSCLTYSKFSNINEQDDPNLKKCKEGKISFKNSLMYGEHTDENKQDYVVRRLTFNPMFNEMMKDIFEFIKNINNNKGEG